MQADLTDSQFTPLSFHEGHGTEEGFGDLELEFGEEFLYGKTDELKVTSMGVHIGSATTQAAISRLLLRRGDHSLSSQSLVKSKEVAYESPIVATAYRDDGDLDWGPVKTFLEQAYDGARLIADLIDTGVVVASGPAATRRGDELLQLMGLDARKFFVIREAKSMQALLAAWGAGALKKSASEKTAVLNVDLGAEGIRFAWIDHGRAEATTATSWGAAIVTFDAAGKLARAGGMASALAAQLGFSLEAGRPVTLSERQALAAFLADVIVRYIQGERLSEAEAAFAPQSAPLPVASVQFSGGVAEYVYGYETQPRGDLGYELGTAIRRRASKLALKMQVHTPPFRIRATPIGVSKQVIRLPADGAFSVPAGARAPGNLMVIAPRFSPQAREAEARTAIQRALARVAGDPLQAFAFSTDFVSAESLDAAARAFAAALRTQPSGSPLVLVGESRVAHDVARKVAASAGIPGGVVALCGVHCHELDVLGILAVDGGQNAPELTVTVQSLVFR
jgi:ethanolamine utilization protein EutA